VTPSSLAWTLWAAAALLIGGGLALAGGEVVLMAIIVAGFSTVGALVASRHPANPIGWIFSATGMAAAVQGLALAYALRALRDPGMLLGASVAAWIQEWLWIPLIGLPSIFGLLLFPDGRLSSARWRPVLWTGVVATGMASLGFALKPGRLTNDPRLVVFTNPLGVLPGGETVGVIGLGLLLVTALAAVASLVERFRRVGGEQRQQIKWFAFGGSLLGVTVVVGSILWQISPIARFLVPVSLVLAPVGAGLGILRHRLFDIDLIINRTLVYGGLTSLLGTLYVVSVILLGWLLRPLAGSSDLAVAASTLAAVGAFQPARRRIQAFVDHRFYRRKYDAGRALEAFAGRLREEVDLDSLTAELVRVVDQTMQPTHISLWLPPESEVASDQDNREKPAR
jgi:hypothetical protein